MRPIRQTLVSDRYADDTMHEVLLSAGRAVPDAPAVIELDENQEPRALSFGALRQRVDDYAAVLQDLGLDVGDRVVLDADASGTAIAMMLACATLGLPFVPVSPETPTARLRAIAATIEPALHLQADHGTRQVGPECGGTGRFGEHGLELARRP